MIHRLLLGLLLSLLLPAAMAAGDDPAALQAVLERHLQDDVAFWADEPRLLQLLRDQNQRNAALTAAELAALDARWQAELDSDATPLADVLFSRFASKYFAEVVLRVGGAYTQVLALDLRGIVVAANDQFDRLWLQDEPCVALLAQNPLAPWVQDVRPQAGRPVRVAMPLDDPDTGARIGTLLLELDVSRLPAPTLVAPPPDAPAP